jgi:hypothetical protein
MEIRTMPKLAQFTIDRVITVAVLMTIASAAACGGGSSAPSVEVKISVPHAAGSIGKATIVVDYSKSGAKPQVAGSGPACTSILPHVSCRFSDDGAGKLTIEAEAPQGFSTPVDLAVCRMVPATAGTDAATIGGKLAVAIADARDTGGQAIQDIKVASGSSRREPSAAGGGADRAAPGGAAGEAAGDGSGATAGAPGSGGAVSGTAEGQGMVVTREDLAARERQRAEEQMRGQGAAPTQRPIIQPGPGRAGTDSGAESGDAGDATDDGEGAEADDPEEYAADATEYGIRFDVGPTDGPIGALQIEVDHTGTSGAWLGAKAGVACRWMVSASLHACNDKGGGKLSCAVVDTTGFTGPTGLMECSFKSKNAVSASDFTVDVVDASSPGLEPIDVRVVVAGVYAR